MLRSYRMVVLMVL